MSTPGAQSTINLSRGPLENSAPVEDSDVQLPYGDESTTGTPATESLRSASPVSHEVVDPSGETFEQAPVHFEAPGKESEHPTFLTPCGEPIGEESPPDLVEHLHHPPLNEPGVMAADAETPASLPDVSNFLDGLATSLAEPSKPAEAEHFPWMDGVLEQIELEAAKLEATKHTEEGDERPRFLDVLGDLSLPAVESEASSPTVVSPALAEVSNLPQTVAGPAVQYRVERSSRRKWRTWLATAVVLAFAVLGTMEWLSRRNDAIVGPLEFVKTQVRKWESKTLADADSSSQATKTDEQANPQTQNPATDPNTPAAARNEDPGPVKTTVPANAASQVQGSPPAQDQQGASVKNIAPGERENNRAEHTRNVTAKSIWLWRATAKGNPDAPVQLAEMYIKGDGVPRSCEQAVVLLKTAAINNNARACNRLAAMYTMGTCVTRNHVKAYRWLSAAVAADPASQSTQQNRDLVWNQMTPEERTLAQKYR